MLTTARWISSPWASSSSPSAPARRFAAARPAQRRDDALLAFEIQAVEALDDRRRRPVAERALQHVDGAGAPARSAIAERVGLLRPADDLVQAIAPVARHRAPSSLSAASASATCSAPPRGENSATTSSRGGPQQALVRLRDPRRCAPQLRGIVERERVAERLEDDVVDVVVLEVAHLAAQRRRDSGPAPGRAGSAAAWPAGPPVRRRSGAAPGTPGALP